MRLARPLFALFIAFALAGGCTADNGAYEADWEGESPFAGGKADGLLDIVPTMDFENEGTGEVGGEDFDLYKVELLRTDRIELTMTVTDGDLNPHLSFYRGTSSYIGSESWRRDGASLIKTYEVEDAGTFLIAVRAYRGEGSGQYTLTMRCDGGPCAGELPPPASHLGTGEIAGCITQARRCAFDRLPSYDGRVGEVRSQLLFQECLDEAHLDDGSSCTHACTWVNPDDERDTAADVCNRIISDLPFWADQNDACLGTLDSCFSDCFDVGSWQTNWDDELAYTTEATCWASGLNSDCPTFARNTAECGGEILADSARECNEHCLATQGAFTDDTQDICGRDAYCDDYCDVDIAAARAACDGVAEQHDCLVDWLDYNEAWFCESALEE